MLLSSDQINLWQSFIELFTGMSPVAGVCYALGLILIVIEIFQQGMGLFGFVGGALTVLGVLIRLQDSGNLAHLFLMTLVAMFVLVAAFLVMARATRLGWIRRAAGLHANVDLKDVTGREGYTLTDLKPSGKVEFGGRVYDAVTLGDAPVDSERPVVAVGLADDFIIVEETEKR